MYVDALGRNQAEIAKFVKLFALIGRMRLYGELLILVILVKSVIRHTQVR